MNISRVSGARRSVAALVAAAAVAGGGFLLLAAPGCSGGDTAQNLSGAGRSVSGDGTVIYLSFEGGFYGIQTDRGEKFLPMNLDPAFAKKDLRVRFEAVTVDPPVATFVQWGTPVRINAVQTLP